MSNCAKCGKWVNWNDPNMHYGGHNCDPLDVAKYQASLNAKTTDSTLPIKNNKSHDNLLKNEKLTWKDVFNAYTMYPKKFDDVVEFISTHTSYRYLAFNGLVYAITDKDMKYPICKESQL